MMYPTSRLNETTAEIPAGHVSGDTRLSMRDYRRIMMFLTHCLHAKGLFDIHVRVKYPALESNTDITAATNLL